MTALLLWIQDRILSTRIALFLVLLSVSAVFAGRNIGESWMASGNDMQFILEELENPDSWILDWVAGPWVGKEMFVYYRPVTSTAWWLEYTVFGENQAAWQCVSLLLYLGAVTFLFLLLCRIFGNGIAPFVGVGVWAFREKTVLLIQWVPAQTDLLAGFFAISCLYFWNRYLMERKQSALALSFLLCVLALGSKEVALVLPLLAAALAAYRRDKKWVLISIGCVAFLGLFIALRTVALGGIGFVPGDKVGTSQGGIEATSAIRNMIQFVLPAPLGLGGVILPTLILLFTTLSIWIFRKKSIVSLFALAIFGLALSTVALGGIEWWFLPQTIQSILLGMLCGLLILFAAKWESRGALLALITGVLFSVFAIRVVFNSAGNVFYLPHIYWAIAWGALITAMLNYARKTCRLSEIAPTEGFQANR